MQHLLLHPGMLAANGAVYDYSSGFSRNAAGGSRSNRAIDYRESRPVLMNVFYYLSNELAALKWEAYMHNIALGNGCGLIDIYPKRSISALHNLQQRLTDLTEANDNDSLVHSRNRNRSGALDRR